MFTPAELAKIAADAEELTRPDLERHYLYLLKEKPKKDRVEALLAKDGAADEVVVRGRAAHLLLGQGLPGRQGRPVGRREDARRGRHQPQPQRGHDTGAEVVLVASVRVIVRTDREASVASEITK